MQGVTKLFFANEGADVAKGSLCEGAGSYGIEEGRGESLSWSPERVSESEVVIVWGQNPSVTNSHVLPALIRKIHEAKKRSKSEITLWGSGSPKREFLFVDDLAEACVFLMKNYNNSKIVNIGTGKDLSIRELAEIIKKTIGYEGKINWDTSKPDGTPRKLLNVDFIHKLGWKHKTSLEEGIQKTYEWYKNNLKYST